MTYTTTTYAAQSTLAADAIIARSITLDEKIQQAERRSFHSFFDIHVIENEDGTYSLFEEGDYGAIPNHLIDSITYTADGKMSDEF